MMLNKKTNNDKPALWQLKKWIILIGLPGCGKSTLGLALSKALDLPFYDSDTEITRAANMSISDIFTQYGEDEFRRMEELVIARLLSEKPAILALGGGAFENLKTQHIIKEKGFSVWLNVDHDTLLKRITHRKGRPLFDQSQNPKQTLADLAQRREKSFAQANIEFRPPDGSISIAARRLNHILRKFSLFRRRENETTHR